MARTNDFVSLELEGAEHLIRELNKTDDNVSRKGTKKATSAAARVLKKNLKAILRKSKSPAAPGEPPGRVKKNLINSVDFRQVKTRNKRMALAIVGHRRDRGAGASGRHAHLLEFGHLTVSGSFVQPRPYFKKTFIRSATRMHAVIKKTLTEHLYA